MTQNVSVRSVAEEVLSDLHTNCINFTQIQNKQWGKKVHYSDSSRVRTCSESATKTLKQGVKYI